MFLTMACVQLEIDFGYDFGIERSLSFQGCSVMDILDENKRGEGRAETEEVDGEEEKEQEYEKGRSSGNRKGKRKDKEKKRVKTD